MYKNHAVYDPLKGNTTVQIIFAVFVIFNFFIIIFIYFIFFPGFADTLYDPNLYPSWHAFHIWDDVNTFQTREIKTSAVLWRCTAPSDILCIFRKGTTESNNFDIKHYTLLTTKHTLYLQM